jgi:hypothetical protein
MSDKIRNGFEWQIAACRQLGSDFTADVLAGLIDVLDHSTQTGARILDWVGEPRVDALTLRIAGGLNALARSGQDGELSALYAARAGDWQGVFRRVLRVWDDWLFPWLDTAPQTNEVGRAGVLWPGMMEIARRFGPRIEILELGASAGLNLNMDRFAYDLCGVTSGDSPSTVKLKPKWDGPRPAHAAVEIIARSGVDLNPLDVSDRDVAVRMMAYIWPDQGERVARTDAAIAIAQAHPVLVDAGDGAEWVERQLAKPQAKGVTRVVFHSIALQYFPEAGRKRVTAAIKAAGASATAQRPVAWLCMEFPAMEARPELSLRCWPGGGARQILAYVHPHGASVNWLGPASPPPPH